MISSLLTNERANRSQESRGAHTSSAQGAHVCVDRVAKRDHFPAARISFPPQRLLTQRSQCEAALLCSVHVFSNQISPEA